MPCPVGQNYAEASFFDGYAFSHIAEYLLEVRARRRRLVVIRAGQRATRRGIRR